MKHLIIILFAFSFSVAKAQVDTTKLPISIQFKVKHIGYMGGSLYNNNTLADATLRDSLIKYLGSGNNQDSVVTVHLKAGYILSFIQGLFFELSQNTYATIYEIGNGGSGYTGIVAQLLIKGTNPNDSENGVARWLYSQIASILSSGQNTMSNRFTNGKTWLKNPITQN